MTKRISGAACAAVVLSAALAAAQSTTPGQPTPKTTPDRKPATITGCVVRDAANGGEASISSNGISYKLTGKDDKELDQYLGKRVEVTGVLDNRSSAARATGGKVKRGDSGAPKDQTATGGQSDVTATGTPRDNTVPPDAIPLATDKGTTADLTRTVQVKTLRLVAPNCL